MYWVAGKMANDPLRELLYLSKQIARSPKLVQQLILEIEGRKPSELLRQLYSCLCLIHPQTLGVAEHSAARYFVPSCIAYTQIYDSPELSVSFFAMAKGTALPLHDHPEMAVITRVIQGRLKFKLADLVHRENDRLFTYRCKDIGELSAPGTLALTPAMCNLHQFLAMENTIMLDVFIPNYSHIRDVTYFLEVGPTQLCSLQSTTLTFHEERYCGVSVDDAEYVAE